MTKSHSGFVQNSTLDFISQCLIFNILKFVHVIIHFIVGYVSYDLAHKCFTSLQNIVGFPSGATANISDTYTQSTLVDQRLHF